MYDPSNLRCRLRLPMRHADTCGLHLVVPYVGYVPGEIHVSMVESPPQRSAPEPYEGPVVQSGLRVREFLRVAAYRYSLGYTCAVPLGAGRRFAVVSQRVGGYGGGLCLRLSSCRCQASDSLYYAVSLPRLGLTIALSVYTPRVFGSVYLGLLLPVCANVPFP